MGTKTGADVGGADSPDANPLPRRRHLRRAALATSLLLAGALLTSCGLPDRSIASPIGTWRAVPNDSGTLTFNTDGTFAFADASFDPLASRDNEEGYDGVGRWQLSTSHVDVYLTFTATPKDRTTAGSQISVPFRSGRIDFHDAEETVGITFELDD